MDTQENNQIADVNVSAPEPLSVGNALREAREKMGLSINDVANRIKFASRQIESLEADEYDKLPEAAFVRGFVRSYARLLELDSTRLLSALPSSHVKSSLMQEMKSVDIPMPTEVTGRRNNIILLAAGLIIALSVAIYERLHDSSPSVTEPVVAATKVVQLDLPNVAAESMSASAPQAESGKEAKPVVAPAPAPAPAATVQAPQPQVHQTPVHVAPVPAAPKQAVPAAPVRSTQAVPAPVQQAVPPVKTVIPLPNASATSNGSEHALRLEFDEDSWVEIKDASEKVLVSKMHRAGSLVRLTGKAPLNVTIGNARAVRLFDNGKKLNLERNTTADVAHIILN